MPRSASRTRRSTAAWQAFPSTSPVPVALERLEQFARMLGTSRSRAVADTPRSLQVHEPLHYPEQEEESDQRLRKAADGVGLPPLPHPRQGMSPAGATRDPAALGQGTGRRTSRPMTRCVVYRVVHEILGLAVTEQDAIGHHIRHFESETDATGRLSRASVASSVEAI